MSAEYKIKVSTLKDEEAVNELLCASFSSLLSARYDDIELSPILPKITRVNPSLLTSGTYYIAQNKEAVIVGCGGWTHERPGMDPRKKNREEGLAHIRHFATHPDWIGKGIGRALYNKCVKIARMEKVSCFECYSTLNGEAFYKSLGFKPLKEFNVDLGDGLTLPSILMKAEI